MGCPTTPKVHVFSFVASSGFTGMVDSDCEVLWLGLQA